MPSALSFASSDELVAALKGRPWKDDLEKAHLGLEEDLGPLTAVYVSVGSSTYRRFPKYRNSKPSVVFRSCVSEELFTGALSKLRQVSSNEQYLAWAKGLARRLDREWQKHLRYSLDLPVALKLVNLLAKGLCIVSPLWPDQYRTIIEHIDVPLDQFSLQPLACIEGLRHLRKASMGSVKTLVAYDKIQDTIRKLCKEADVPPVAYDFLAWDGPHAKRAELGRVS